MHGVLGYVFCFKHRAVYELRISDRSSYVCSSDLTAAMKSATDTSVALVLISALAMAFLPGADDSPRAAGRQAGCTFSGSLLAAPASFPRQRCIMSESFKRVVLAYSGGLDTSVILKWLQEIGRASVRERVCPYV